jgi:hypothetical protein
VFTNPLERLRRIDRSFSGDISVNPPEESPPYSRIQTPPRRLSPRFSQRRTRRTRKTVPPGTKCGTKKDRGLPGPPRVALENKRTPRGNYSQDEEPIPKLVQRTGPSLFIREIAPA